MAHQVLDLAGNKPKVDSINAGSEYLSAGTTRTLTTADFGKTVKLDNTAGCTVTLPAATGSGRKIKFVVTTLATAGNHIVKVANTNDAMQGTVIIENTAGGTNATLTFAASAGTSDTITLNRTTTGSVTKGEWVEVEDLASTVWQVYGVVTATTSPATVFSATV